MPPRYVKSPQYKGRDIQLMIGRGLRTIRDGMVLEGEEYDIFLKHGLLVRLPDRVMATEPVVAEKPKEQTKPLQPAVVPVESDAPASDLLRAFRDAMPTPIETPIPVSEESVTRAPDPEKRRRGRPRK